MMERFNQLALREQILVTLAAILVLAFIGWSLVWTPLRNRTTELDRVVAEKSRLVVDLHRASGLRGATGSAASAPSQTMMLLVDQTARSRGLSFVRSRNEGSSAYSVSFQNAPFDGLVEWLIELQLSHGVNVTSASISGVREAGLVDGQIFLDRS